MVNKSPRAPSKGKNMQAKTDINQVWAVIKVRRGILNHIALFRDENDAYREYNYLNLSLNPEDDDLQIVNIPIVER